MQSVVSKLETKKIWWVLALGAGIGILLSSFYLPGGDDLYRYYIPFEQGCFDCGFVPYFAQWFLLPLRLLPEYPSAWPIWTAVSLFGFIVLARFTDVNPLLLLTSFPMLGQIWLGQIDVVVCTGLVLFLLAKNPYLRGFGVALALTKPQLTALALLFGFLSENRTVVWKLFVIPVITFLLSVLVWGGDWPLYWISNALTSLPSHVWRMASADIWKFGLFLLPLPLIVGERRKRLQAGLLVSALATPFFGVYSYVTFLLLQSTWWTWVLSFAWVLAYAWLRPSAMRFAWILPLVMLSHLVYEEWRDRRRMAGGKKSISSVSG